MPVRAKFYVKSIEAVPGTQNAVEIKLAGVYETRPGVEGNANENRFFTKWTPQGEITMMVTNPDAAASFELGAAYYVDFSPAD